HRRHARAVLAGLALEERAPDLHRQVARQERLQDRGTAGLEDVLRGDEALLAWSALDLRARLQRQKLHQTDLLHDGALELVVQQVHRVELVAHVRLDQVIRDLARLRVAEPPEEPDVVLARLDPALAGEIAAAPSYRGELDAIELATLLDEEALPAA